MRLVRTNSTWRVAVLAFAFLGTIRVARAEGPETSMEIGQEAPSDSASSDSKDKEIDREHIFGFTEGSDIGKKGELEVEAVSAQRLGKQFGSYAVTSTALQTKYGLSDELRVAPAILVSRRNISGVSGYDDGYGFALEGFGAEMRSRLLNRATAPIGLTLSLFPQWGLVDEKSGMPVRQYGAELTLLVDRELIGDRLFAALNMSYEFNWTWPSATGTWQKESPFSVGGALAYQIMPGMFVGGETRDLRAYEGVVLDAYVGNALFVGPTFHVTRSGNISLTLAWNAQIAGKAANDFAALDLINFERHQVRTVFRKGF